MFCGHVCFIILYRVRGEGLPVVCTVWPPLLVGGVLFVACTLWLKRLHVSVPQRERVSGLLLFMLFVAKSECVLYRSLYRSLCRVRFLLRQL